MASSDLPIDIHYNKLLGKKRFAEKCDEPFTMIQLLLQALVELPVKQEVSVMIFFFFHTFFLFFLFSA
jgi:hypothetical protein